MWSVSKGVVAERVEIQQLGCNGNMGRSKTHVSCLYPEILALIFGYLDLEDKGRVAQVCKTWRDAAYHKSVWRGVEAKLNLLPTDNSAIFRSIMTRGIRKVQVLSLHNSVRDVVHGIPNLASLSLSGCYDLSDFCITDAFTLDLPYLTVINLSMCKQITDRSIRRIAASASNLEVLDLAGCSNITNNGLLYVAIYLHKLKSINLRSCRNICDIGIGHLAGLCMDASERVVTMEFLGLQDCQKVTNNSLGYISTRFNNLKSLNLSFCAGISDDGLKHLGRMTSLQDLNLSSCDNMTDQGLSFLAEGNSQITVLDMSFCDKIGDEGLLHISQGLFNLKSLSLISCPISDEGISRIAQTLSDLQVLNIAQCSRVTDKGLGLIADHFQKLWWIDLYGCLNVTTVGLEKVMQLPNLNVLNLGLWQSR